MATTDHFIGVDVGTSSVKALVVDRRGAIRATVTIALPMSTPEPGWAEQDPDRWWTASAAAIRRVCTEAKIRPAAIAAIGLSGQMHSSVFLDRTGAVIRPALLWCDGRTTAECATINQRVGEKQLQAWTLNPALEGFTLPKLLWLRRHEPAAFRRLTCVVLAKDYVRFALTGVLATEPSDASGTLMYETARLRWCEPLMRELSLPLALLPQVGGSTEILGRVSARAARRIGLLAGTPVVGGGADNACGAVGVGAVLPGLAVVSWGTSGTVLAPTPRPIVDAKLRAHTFCHANPGSWYAMGVMLTAGAAFAWHRRVAGAELDGQDDANRRLNQEAARVPIGAQGLTFLPYLQGERTPHRNAAARGAFVGLSLAHTRAHLTRAVLEGITFGLRDCLAVLQDMGLPISRAVVTGGGAESPFLRQLQADVFGLPVVRIRNGGGPGFGAALLAAVGVGAWDSVADACKAAVKRQPPEPPLRRAHRAYEPAYARFRQLYPALNATPHPPDGDRESIAAGAKKTT